MNIGIDIRPLMSPVRTGVGEYTYELLNALFEIDQKNQYFLFCNSYKNIDKNLPNWKFNNVHFIKNGWPNKVFNFCQKFLGWPKIDKIILKEINYSVRPLCHFVTPPLVKGRTTLVPSLTRRGQGEVLQLDYFFFPNLNFTALSKKVKKILTVHDLSFEMFPEFFTFKDFWWYKIINPKKQCHQAEIILTPSENTKQDLINIYKIKNEKIKIIYPGLSSIFKAAPNQNKTLELPDNYILFLGSIEPRKNILAVIDAYEKAFTSLPLPYNLVIAGAPGWKNKEIFKKIAQSPLKQKINFVGYVKNEDKLELYRRAAVFVYPSFYEGFGFPVLEAMNSNIPVVASNRSSIPEITGSFAWLVDPNKPAQTSAGLIAILNDEKVKNEMITKAKEKAATFSWEKAARQFLEVLK